MGEAYAAIFWPDTWSLKGRTFVSSGFSIEGTLISASSVSHYGITTIMKKGGGNDDDNDSDSGDGDNKGD